MKNPPQSIGYPYPTLNNNGQVPTLNGQIPLNPNAQPNPNYQVYPNNNNVQNNM